MARLYPTRLWLRLALASVVSALALALVCGVGLVSLDNVSEVTRSSLTRQVALLDDTATFAALLYQKGFFAEYLVTGDARWLSRLAASRAEVDSWLERARAGAASEEVHQLLGRIEAEYAAYDRARSRAIALFGAGRIEEAKAITVQNNEHTERLLALAKELSRLGRTEAEGTLTASRHHMRRLSALLVATSIAGALASLALGFLVARRYARPIYELHLKVESAEQRTRIEVTPGTDALEQLGERVGAIVQKLEDADATLVEQRRRLVQSEKLSAVGELAAKLAHEILNPLAGMKAATQLLSRSKDLRGVSDASEALDREIGRVAELVGRLVDYSRPLQPRIEVVPVGRLLDGAVEAARAEIKQIEVEREEEPGLPPIEVDPLLMTQALVNLLRNAAQAMPGGGRIVLRAARAREPADLGREQLRLSVADQGEGIRAEHLPLLFHPFFTTRARGNGLGLAVTQNIVLEHGGRIAGRNRDDCPGAVFDLYIPLVR